MGYEKDKKLEERFQKTIKAILGNYFIGQSVEHDRQEATDFEIFTVRPFTVGVRLRRYSFFLDYPDEFTIRWSRPSGASTEIHKIRQGLVDYILYGFVDEEEQKIIQYFIGDLGVFRKHEPEPLCIKPNDPYDSKLAAYQLSSLPITFILHLWRRNKTQDALLSKIKAQRKLLSIEQEKMFS